MAYSKKSIRIFNPQEIPFGPLSNNAVRFMKIDNKRWPTVTNYILSNMLITPAHRLALETAKIMGSRKKTNSDQKLNKILANLEFKQGYPVRDKKTIQYYRDLVEHDIRWNGMDIYQKYEYLLGEEYFNTCKNALEQAYNAILYQERSTPNDPQLFINALLSTNNRPIIYESNNTVLGQNEQGVGHNLVGLMLMQVRHNLILEEKQQKLEEKAQVMRNTILNAYRANLILQDERNRGNNLNDYLQTPTSGKTSREIIAQYVAKNKSSKLLELKGVDGRDNEDVIIESYKRGYYPLLDKEVEYPGYLVLYHLHQQLKTLREKLVNNRDNTILEMYTYHVLKNQYPDMEDERLNEAVRQLISAAPDLKQYYLMRANIVNLFENKYSNFPEKLREEIQAVVNQFHIPSQADIKIAEDAMLNKENRGTAEYRSSPSEQEIQENTDSVESNTEIGATLKNLLNENDKKSKDYLISRIQRYTTHTKSKLRKLSVEKLKEYLAKYEGSEKTKMPKKNTGKWVIKAKINRPGFVEKIIIGKISHDNEDEVMKNYEIDRAIDKYQKRHPDKKIRRNQIHVIWEPTKASEDEDIEIPEINDEKTSNASDIGGYIKVNGLPIKLKPFPEDNDEKLQVLAPLYNYNFLVQSQHYPNISTFIMTILMTTLGIIKEKKVDQLIFKRGRSIIQAREILMSDGKFYDIEKITQIYENEKRAVFEELLCTFARVAMYEKFGISYQAHEDGGKTLCRNVYLGNQIGWKLTVKDTHRDLQNLLLLTGDANLFWNDPHDVFLGMGPKNVKGDNVAGKILVEIREIIQESRQNIKLKPLDIDKLGSLIMNDTFVQSWFKMRANDVCMTIYRVLQFLWNSNVVINQNFKVDDEQKFVKKVLRTVYRPCNGLDTNDQVISIAPNFFVQSMLNCSGMKIRYEQNYNKLIEEIRQKILKLSSIFYGDIEQTHVEIQSPREYQIKQQQERERLLQTNPTPKELENLDRKHKMLWDAYVAGMDEDHDPAKLTKKFNHDLAEFKKTNPTGFQYEQFRAELQQRLFPVNALEKKEREEWQEFYQNLFSENFSIQQTLHDIKYHKELVPIIVKKHEDNIRALKRKRQPVKKMLNDVFTSHKYPDKEVIHDVKEDERYKGEVRNLAMKDFMKIQEERRKQYYGGEQKRSEEEFKRYKQQKLDLEQEILKLEKAKQEEHDKSYKVKIETVNIVWKYLMSIFYYVVSHLNNRTEEDIRKAIVMAWNVTSQEQSCDTIVQDLEDEFENCIVSALTNLLVSIREIKKKYSPELPFSKSDIDLAASILLNRDIAGIIEEESEKEVQSNNLDIAPDQIDDDLLDIELDDLLDELDDIFDGDSAEMNFGMSVKNLQPNMKEEAMHALLLQVVQHENVQNFDGIVAYFIDMINVIKTNPLPKQIKVNRVNFFATLL